MSSYSILDTLQLIFVFVPCNLMSSYSILDALQLMFVGTDKKEVAGHPSSEVSIVLFSMVQFLLTQILAPSIFPMKKSYITSVRHNESPQM